MRTYPYHHRVVAVSVIVLLVALAPSLHADTQPTPDNELLEFTTEICGLQGQEPQTVQLTQEQAEEIDKIFMDVRIKGNTAETIEQTVEIFNEALVKLNKYHLFSEVSVKHLQTLITGVFQQNSMKELIEKTHIAPNSESNFFCLITGNTDYTIFNSRLSTLFLVLCFLFIGIDIFIIPWMVTYYLTNSIPLSLGQTIALGVQGTQWTYPAEGWVFTQGLTGVQEWEGTLIGDIRYGILDELIGVTGFRGVKISNSHSSTVKYLGFARRVQIQTL